MILSVPFWTGSVVAVVYNQVGFVINPKTGTTVFGKIC